MILPIFLCHLTHLYCLSADWSRKNMDFGLTARVSTRFHAIERWRRLLQNFKCSLWVRDRRFLPLSPACAGAIKTWITLRTLAVRNRRGARLPLSMAKRAQRRETLNFISLRAALSSPGLQPRSDDTTGNGCISVLFLWVQLNARSRRLPSRPIITDITEREKDEK